MSEYAWLIIIGVARLKLEGGYDLGEYAFG